MGSAHGDRVARKWERIERQTAESQRRLEASRAEHPPIPDSQLKAEVRKRWKRAHRRRTPWGYTWRTLIAVPAWLVSLGVIWALATSFPLAFGAAGLIGGTVVTTGIVWAWVTGR